MPLYCVHYEAPVDQYPNRAETLALVQHINVVVTINISQDKIWQSETQDTAVICSNNINAQTNTIY